MDNKYKNDDIVYVQLTDGQIILTPQQLKDILMAKEFNVVSKIKKVLVNELDALLKKAGTNE